MEHQATTRPTATAVDVATMREVARRVLAMGEPRPQLENLAAAMRGMVHLLIPEIRTLISGQPSGDAPVKVAQIGVDEAWRRLTTPRGFGPDAAYRHSRKLALSVLSLCDHFESLAGSES